MKFWDSSAAVPLILQQASSARMHGLLRKDPVMLVWWGTEVECVSAVARIERLKQSSSKKIGLCLSRLKKLTSSWQEVQPSDSIKEQSMRLLRVHNLRAADALQLAAAVIASGHSPSSLEFLCLDARLAAAAQLEGFEVLQ